MKLEGEALAEEIYKRLQEHKEPVINMHLLSEKAGILESKIGGAFYVPEGMEPSRSYDSEEDVDDEDKEDLYLLAQINFREIAQIDTFLPFPKKGLLQIFIGGDALYGCDFDNMAEQDTWRLRFFEDLPNEADILPEQIYEPEWTEDTYLPFSGREVQYRMKGELAQQAVTLDDYRVLDYLKKYCADLIPEDLEYLWDLGEEAADTLIYLREEPFDCQIGGFPIFTQSDPREYAKDDNIPEILLFQLHMANGIMWGDAGVGNFFIKEEDLKNKDFSKVWYTWDCG